MRREPKEASMALRNESFDLVIVGGGIAGNALAAVLARGGK
jgi:glycerol-3-phosphate dehydrogenase